VISCGTVRTKPSALLVLSLSLSLGCSAVWVTRPKGDKLDLNRRCTDSYAPPIVDSLAVALFGGGATNIAINYPEKRTFAAVEAVVAAGFLASAIYGYIYVGKCNGQVKTAQLSETYPPPAAQAGAPPVVATQPPAPKLQGKRLVILDFLGKDFEADALSAFGDAVRTGAFEVLHEQGVVIMNSDNLPVLLREQGKRDCQEGDCELDTARNVGADYVILGRVVKIEGSIVVTLKLHETKSGEMLASETARAASREEILRSMQEHGRRLVGAGFGLSSRPASAP
jgi:hypothetical protein